MRERDTILVVDDDAAMTGLLGDFLRMQGYAVVTAYSAAGALGWLESMADTSVDLVVSDVELGTASGIQLANRLRIERPGLPVILFSVFDGHQKASLESGARQFLRKPFALSTLAALVAESLSTETV